MASSPQKAAVAKVQRADTTARQRNDFADRARMYAENPAYRHDARARMRSTPPHWKYHERLDILCFGNQLVEESFDVSPCVVIYYLDGRIERTTSLQRALHALKTDEPVNMAEKVYNEKTRHWFYAE